MTFSQNYARKYLYILNYYFFYAYSALPPPNCCLLAYDLRWSYGKSDPEFKNLNFSSTAVHRERIPINSE